GVDRADGQAVDAGLAPGGLEQRGEDLDGRGLAGAVGPDESEAVALLDLEVEVRQRHQLAVTLGQVDGVDHRHERTAPRSTAATAGTTGTAEATLGDGSRVFCGSCDFCGCLHKSYI